jgi:hypothetical protein
MCLDRVVAAIRERGKETLELNDLAEWRDVAIQADIANYLKACLTRDGYVASGIRVKGLDALREENTNLAPGAQIRSLGYLVIATDFGGNAVVFSTTGEVLFADHTSYNNPSQIKFEDRATGQWQYVPWSPENVRLSMVVLATSIETFLLDLLADRLTQQLDALD